MHLEVAGVHAVELAGVELADAWTVEPAGEEILLALETEAQSEMAARELLKKRADGMSWDEIWRGLGLIE